MRKNILTIIAFLFATNISAQEILTLDKCQQDAKNNYPLIKQYDLIAKTEQYTLSNIGKVYLPQVAFNAQATYQSEVTKLLIDPAVMPALANIKSMNKDQYKATIDVTQTIWDGGNVSSKKKVVKATNQVDKQQIEINLYDVKDRVSQLYFGVLAINEQLRLLDLIEEDLQANRIVIESMLRNGVAMQSDLDLIDVELLNIDQNRTEQKSLKTAYCKMLSIFIGQNINEATHFQMIEDNQMITSSITRPELLYYDSQRSLLDAQENSIMAKNMPRVGLFAQGGYGRPGLNMLENKFKLFAIGGVKFTWDFGNLYTKKNERRIIETNRSNIDVQQEIFLFNTSLKLTQELGEIHKLEKLLARDNEIIELRARVKKAGESKYRNGVYQANDLIRDISAENQARQTQALRKIQYLLSIYNYKHIQGN